MSFETPCGSYAHFKLTRYLLRITRDARYGDSMERIFYNASLGALPIQPDGRAFYYSDYTRCAQKSFHPDRWPCCSGTLPLLAADYAISACFLDEQGIFVNLYVPAHVTWSQDSVRCGLGIITQYPYDGVIRLELELPAVVRFSLRLRIPHWAADAQVYINGQRQSSGWLPGTFAALQRDWSPGDRVELVLPLPSRLLSVDADHPDDVALVHGPLVLMRVLDGTAGDEIPLTRRALLATERTPHHPRDRQLNAERRTITFRPFMDIGAESYRLYQSSSLALHSFRSVVRRSMSKPCCELGQPVRAAVKEPRFERFIQSRRDERARDHENQAEHLLAVTTRIHETPANRHEPSAGERSKRHQRRCSADTKNEHQEEDLGQALALTCERGGSTQSRADAGTPDDTDHRADEKLSHQALACHTREQGVAGIAHSAREAGESVLQARHQQHDAERDEQHRADGAESTRSSPRDAPQGRHREPNHREGHGQPDSQGQRSKAMSGHGRGGQYRHQRQDTGRQNRQRARQQPEPVGGQSQGITAPGVAIEPPYLAIREAATTLRS